MTARKDPDRLLRQRIDWAPFVAELEKTPGAWTATPIPVSTSRLLQGDYLHFRPLGHFDARNRSGVTEVVYLGPPATVPTLRPTPRAHVLDGTLDYEHLTGPEQYEARKNARARRDEALGTDEPDDLDPPFYDLETGYLVLR